MDIKLYNTLSKKVEEFKPIKAGSVGMYHCGPTVYDHAHIGNLRSYVFADVLRRTFEYNSYRVHQTINITDVGHLVSDGDEGEDKMTKALKREHKPLTLEAMHEIATKYLSVFLEDLKELNIETPHDVPRASDHITEDIELIRALEQKGFTYKISDGIYFDTSKFSTYGTLGGLTKESSLSSTTNHNRVAANPEKKNPADFSLWKLDPKLGWDSPWGRGFPGWHLECSAMSRKYLGQPFDIHTGGIDHIPVHHNNEIAQSEAAYDAPLAHYWLHNEFIRVGDSKMAKSSGNFLTLEALREQAIAPLAYRYWLLTAHYRSPINFSIEALQGAQNALIKLISTVSSYPDGGDVDQAYTERFKAFMNNDLDTPKALALAWELIKDKNVSDADKKTTLFDFDHVFGLKLSDIQVPIDEEISEEIPAEITALAEAREEARAVKDWAKADALRVEIEERGFEVLDGATGFIVRAR